MQSIASHRTVKRVALALLLQIVNFPLVRIGYTARLRRLVAQAAPGQAKLHLGCGNRPFPGWINVDVIPYSPGPGVLLDLRRPLPALDNSIDLIYSEDLIEHLELAQSRHLLHDCYRVLRPGGTMRLLTPNLRTLAADYVARSPALFEWYNARHGATSFAEILNHGLRSWGHRFVYDDELLVHELQTAGFSPEIQAHNQSSHPALRGLDRADEQEALYRIYLDCVKPR